MITKFKIFENINLKYKINDYVYVVGYPDTDGYCKILSVNKKLNNRTWDYMIEAYGDNNNFWKSYIDESDIERELTPDEIEKYEAKKDAIKYNI
jgi:hypothetical protein